MATKRLVKVLYIEKDIDEKGAARVLEESTSILQNASCVFTVVPNAFSGLEFTETTCYDMIFIRKDLDHLDAMSFLRILRNVGAPMDVVLLLEPEDTMTEEQARSIGFHSVLRKEYQAIQLCSIISDIVSKQESNLMNQNSPRIAPAPALIHPPNRDVLDRRTDPFPEPTRGDLIQDHNLNHLDTSPRGRTRGSSIPMKTNEIISSVV